MVRLLRKISESLLKRCLTRYLEQVKLQLQTTCKHNLIVNEYFDTVKGLADQLSAIGYTVQETDLIVLILGCLGLEFNACVCSLSNRGNDLTIEVIKSQLLSFENFLAQQNKIDDNQVIQEKLANTCGSFSGSKGNKPNSFSTNNSCNNSAGNYSQERDRERGNGNENGRGNGRGRGTQC